MVKKQNEGVIVISALEEDLLTVILNQGKIYGLEIRDVLNQARQKQGMRDLGVGSLYPTLKRMEEQKLIKGEWGEAVTNSTRRRYYTISADGLIAITRTQAYRKELARRKEKQSVPEGKTLGNGV